MSTKRKQQKPQKLICQLTNNKNSKMPNKEGGEASPADNQLETEIVARVVVVAASIAAVEPNEPLDLSLDGDNILDLSSSASSSSSLSIYQDRLKSKQSNQDDDNGDDNNNNDINEQNNELGQSLILNSNANNNKIKSINESYLKANSTKSILDMFELSSLEKFLMNSLIGLYQQNSQPLPLPFPSFNGSTGFNPQLLLAASHLLNPESNHQTPLDLSKSTDLKDLKVKPTNPSPVYVNNTIKQEPSQPIPKSLTPLYQLERQLNLEHNKSSFKSSSQNTTTDPFKSILKRKKSSIIDQQHQHHHHKHRNHDDRSPLKNSDSLKNEHLKKVTIQNFKPTSTTSTNNLNSTSKPNLHLQEAIPPATITKMVRGQEEWVNNSRRHNNFISQILKCLVCSASFETLADLSVHMLKSNHLTRFHSPISLLTANNSTTSIVPISQSTSTSSLPSPSCSTSSSGSSSSSSSKQPWAINNWSTPKSSQNESVVKNNSKPSKPQPQHHVKKEESTPSFSPLSFQSMQQYSMMDPTALNCLICKKQFNGYTHLIQHLQDTHTITQLCTTCGAYFESYAALQRHLLTEHTVNNVANQNKKNKLDFENDENKDSPSLAKKAHRSTPNTESNHSQNHHSNPNSPVSSQTSNVASKSTNDPLLALQMFVNGNYLSYTASTTTPSTPSTPTVSTIQNKTSVTTNHPSATLPAKKRPYIEYCDSTDSNEDKTPIKSKNTCQQHHDQIQHGIKRILSEATPKKQAMNPLLLLESLASLNNSSLSSVPGDNSKEFSKLFDTVPSKIRNPTSTSSTSVSPSSSSSSPSASSSPNENSSPVSCDSSTTYNFQKVTSTTAVVAPLTNVMDKIGLTSSSSSTTSQSYNPLNLLQKMNLNLDEYLFR